MKYKSRAKIYTASNVSFNPEELDARSYSWWRFVKPMGQLVVLNNYRYSPTTARHQQKVRDLMQQLGIQIHATIETPKSLNDRGWAEAAIDLYRGRVEELRHKMLRGRPAKNLERAACIKELEAKIKQVQNLAKMDKVA